MAIWLIRAGSQGDYEQKYIQDSRSAHTPNAATGNIDVPDGQGNQETA